MKTIREMVLLLAAAAMLWQPAAFAERFDGRNPGGPGGPGGGHDTRAPANDFVSRDVRQVFLDGDTIAVRALLGLGDEFNGRRLEFIQLRGNAAQSFGEVALFVNNVQLGSPLTLDRWDRDYTFRLDSRYNVLGTDIRTVQLRVRGRAQVATLAAQLNASGWDNPGRPEDPRQGDFLEVRLNQQFQGTNVLNVRRLLRMGPEYRDREVRRVILRARTERGRGTAQLLVDGYTVDRIQTVGEFTEDYTFFLERGRNRTELDFRNLELDLRGRFTVDSIAVEFERGYRPEPGRPEPGRPGPGRPGPVRPDPRPGRPDDRLERSVNVRVNQYFTGSNTLSVLQVLGLDRRFEGRPISQVTVTASASNGRSYAELVVNGRISGEYQTFGAQMQTNSFFLPTYESVLGRDLRSLELMLRGDFYIESIGVTFADR